METLHPHPARAHLDPRLAAGGHDKLWQQAPDHRQRPLRDGGLRQGQLPKDGQKPLLVGPSRPSTRSTSRPTRTPTRWSRTWPGGIDAAWGIPEAEFAQLESVKGITAIAYPEYNWDYLEFNCYTGKLPGQPRLARLALPSRPQLRDRQTAPLRPGLRRSCAAGHHHHPPTSGPTPTTTGSRRRRALHLRPGQGQPAARSGRVPARAGGCASTTGQADRPASPGHHRQPSYQIEAKLIAGWLEQLGLKIKLSVIDSGTLTATSTTTMAAPGRRTSTWSSRVGRLHDPVRHWPASQPRRSATSTSPTGRTLGTTSSRSNRRAPSIRRQRQAIIWQMQQIMYQQSPWIPLGYPDDLEAIDTAKWTAGHSRRRHRRSVELSGLLLLLRQLRPRRPPPRQVAVTDADRGHRGRRGRRGEYRVRVRAAAPRADRGRGLNGSRLTLEGLAFAWSYPAKQRSWSR